MDRFAIITNRKRAIIALVHSVFFLGVAGVQLAISHAEAFSIHRERIAGSIILLAIYVIVTSCSSCPVALLSLRQGKALLRFLRSQRRFRTGADPAGRPRAACQRRARASAVLRRADRDGHPAQPLRVRDQ